MSRSFKHRGLKRLYERNDRSGIGLIWAMPLKTYWPG